MIGIIEMLGRGKNQSFFMRNILNFIERSVYPLRVRERISTEEVDFEDESAEGKIEEELDRDLARSKRGL